MPRSEVVLTVFVASPSDVEEERNRLEDVIRDMNISWSKYFGIRLDLVKWETHTYPDFGEDAQAVINEQISQDYDVFVAIIWSVLGTPTGRAPSGTVEEFQLAKDRYDSDPSSVKIMIYFKDAPLQPSQLDPEQLQLVKEFRSSLGEEGALYRRFVHVDEFESLVRRHLEQYVQSWIRRDEEVTSQQPGADQLVSTVADDSAVSTVDEQDEEVLNGDEEKPGLLDLEDEMAEEFSALSEVTVRIGEATAEVGGHIVERTKEIEQINRAGLTKAGRASLRRAIARAASDMDKYASRLEAELPLFDKHFKAGMSAFTEAVPIIMSLSANSGNGENREDLQLTIKKLRESMSGSADSLEVFENAVSSLPSMTTRMNRSRRQTARVLQEWIREMRSAQLELADVERLIQSEVQK